VSLHGILDSLGNTFKSIGGAAFAPVTTAYDLASTEIHDVKHGDYFDLGDYLHVMSHGLLNVLDPEQATWASTMSSAGRAVYLSDVMVVPGRRGAPQLYHQWLE